MRERLRAAGSELFLRRGRPEEVRHPNPTLPAQPGCPSPAARASQAAARAARRSTCAETGGGGAPPPAQAPAQCRGHALQTAPSLLRVPAHPRYVRVCRAAARADPLAAGQALCGAHGTVQQRVRPCAASSRWRWQAVHMHLIPAFLGSRRVQEAHPSLTGRCWRRCCRPWRASWARRACTAPAAAWAARQAPPLSGGWLPL